MKSLILNDIWMEHVFCFTNYLVDCLQIQPLAGCRIDNTVEKSAKLNYLSCEVFVSQWFIMCYTNSVSSFLPHWASHSMDLKYLMVNDTMYKVSQKYLKKTCKKNDIRKILFHWDTLYFYLYFLNDTDYVSILSKHD